MIAVGQDAAPQEKGIDQYRRSACQADDQPGGKCTNLENTPRVEERYHLVELKFELGPPHQPAAGQLGQEEGKGCAQRLLYLPQAGQPAGGLKSGDQDRDHRSRSQGFDHQSPGDGGREVSFTLKLGENYTRKIPGKGDLWKIV